MPSKKSKAQKKKDMSESIKHTTNYSTDMAAIDDANAATGDSVPIIELDENPYNADWAKRTWDLPFDNVESLRPFVLSGWGSIEAFKQEPIYKYNVNKLPWLKDL